MPDYHSITFTDLKDSTKSYNTWDNWHLIPTARPVVVQPNVTYKYIDIPGKDGQLDLTNYLIGRPTYSMRVGTFEFYVANMVGNVQKYGGSEFAKDTAVTYGLWHNRRAEIASVLNGSKFKMSLDDDSNYYYRGRVFFKDWKPGPNFSTVTIEYQMEPYRYTREGEEAGL